MRRIRFQPPARAIGRGRVRPVGQRHRRRVAGTEPRIGQPRLAAQRHPRHGMVERRPDARVEPDPRQQRSRRKVHRGERVAEQLVVFEAIATASGRHQLGKDGGGVDRDSAAERDIEVFERNGEAMGALEQLEPGGVGRDRGGELDAGEIGGEVEHGSSLNPPRDGEVAAGLPADGRGLPRAAHCGRPPPPPAVLATPLPVPGRSLCSERAGLQRVQHFSACRRRRAQPHRLRDDLVEIEAYYHPLHLAERIVARRAAFALQQPSAYRDRQHRQERVAPRQPVVMPRRGQLRADRGAGLDQRGQLAVAAFRAQVADQFCERLPAVETKLAPDQIGGLDTVGALVNRGDPRIAEELMFESRPFVMQSKVGGEREKSGLKSSLMRAERYGHHLDQIQSADVSLSQTVQPERVQAPPVQLAKLRFTKKPPFITRRPRGGRDQNNVGGQPNPAANPLTNPSQQQGNSATPAANPLTNPSQQQGNSTTPAANPLTNPSQQQGNSATPAANPLTNPSQQQGNSTTPAANPLTNPSQQQGNSTTPAANQLTNPPQQQGNSTTPAANQLTNPSQQQGNRTTNPEQDLETISKLSKGQDVPEHLQNIFKEAHDTSKDSLGGELPKSVVGNPHAASTFDPTTKKVIKQNVDYMGQENDEGQRIGNLVHELTHASVQKSFGRDYVNYTNPSSENVPEPVINDKGRLNNEAKRQEARKNSKADNSLGVILDDLQQLAVNDKKLTDQQKTQVKEKLSYGMRNAHIEFDTVINQISVWLHYWGVNAKNSKFAERLQQVATQNYTERQSGRRNVATTDREPTYEANSWQPPNNANSGQPPKSNKTKRDGFTEKFSNLFKGGGNKNSQEAEGKQRIQGPSEPKQDKGKGRMKDSPQQQPMKNNSPGFSPKDIEAATRNSLLDPYQSDTENAGKPSSSGTKPRREER